MEKEDEIRPWELGNSIGVGLTAYVDGLVTMEALLQHYPDMKICTDLNNGDKDPFHWVEMLKVEYGFENLRFADAQLERFKDGELFLYVDNFYVNYRQGDEAFGGEDLTSVVERLAYVPGQLAVRLMNMQARMLENPPNDVVITWSDEGRLWEVYLWWD